MNSVRQVLTAYSQASDPDPGLSAQGERGPKIILETPYTLWHLLANTVPVWVGTPPSGNPPYAVFPGYENYARVWNTNHLSRNNLSLVLILPWPNSIVNGRVLPTLIDNVVGSRNRTWVITERPAPRARR
jgi:hypothetical protein